MVRKFAVAKSGAFITLRPHPRSDPCALASTYTGSRGWSRARSGVVRTSAAAPSLSWQQSNSRQGSTIMRAAS